MSRYVAGDSSRQESKWTGRYKQASKQAREGEGRGGKASAEGRGAAKQGEV